MGTKQPERRQTNTESSNGLVGARITAVSSHSPLLAFPTRSASGVARMILPPVGWVRTPNSGGQAQGSTPAPSSIGKSQASGACASASRILHNRPSRLTLHLHTWRAMISTPLLVIERTSPSQNRPLGGNPSTDALDIVSPNYRHGRLVTKGEDGSDGHSWERGRRVLQALCRRAYLGCM